MSNDRGSGSPAGPLEGAAVSPADTSEAARVVDREATRVVERWIGSLPEGMPPRSPELEDAYRAVGKELIHRIVQLLDEMADPVTEPLPLEDIRSLPFLAAESRRSSRAIWQTLDDLQHLLPEILRFVRASPRASQGFEQGAVISSVLSGAVASTARVLEATAVRYEREQSESRASMADMMIHELRNRLSAAETASRMLMAAQAPVDTSWLARVAGLIRASVDAGLRTVDDVRSLAASRILPGSAQPRPVPLALLLQDVVRELEPQAAEHGVRIAGEEEWPDVLVDASRFRLILVNLLGNAVKYHDPAKADPRVEVGLAEPAHGELDGAAGGEDGVMAPPGGWLRLAVRDNGLGIAPSELGNVFLHRFRGDHSRRLDGSGLGLAIAREAAEQLGARISVESRLGEGTTFQLTFRPLVDPADRVPSA